MIFSKNSVDKNYLILLMETCKFTIAICKQIEDGHESILLVSGNWEGVTDSCNMTVISRRWRWIEVIHSLCSYPKIKKPHLPSHC